MDVNALINQAKNTENLEDHTKVPKHGDFERIVAPAGPTPARFVGYVETGLRPQRPYRGQEKPDAEEVRLYFELNGKAHKREVEGDGETKTFTNVISVKLTKKLGDRAGFTKLFRKMTYGRDSITHMAQMLGEAFIITIVHNEEKNPKEGKEPRTFANMKDGDGNWLIGAPRYQKDPLDPESWADVPVEEPTVQIKLLLWDAPSQEQWDSIFIDGTRTIKNEKGEEVEVSKNWLQEDIVSNAKNFADSPLAAMLGGVSELTLEEDVIDDEPEEEVKEPAEEKPATEPAGDPDDILAGLGL